MKLYLRFRKHIALAIERGDTLIFLYNVNASFLDKTAAPILVDPEDGIEKMGEFLLLMAKERAEKQGVNAEIICRRGRFRETFKNVAISENVSLLLLGRPTGEQSVFQLADLKAFANKLKEETGIETQII